jgi:hypothetical protein
MLLAEGTLGPQGVHKQELFRCNVIAAAAESGIYRLFEAVMDEIQKNSQLFAEHHSFIV